MNDVILRLLRAARGGGVRISTAEMLDAFEAVEAVGYDDRQVLRDSLTLTLAKTIEERASFEVIFDTYFRREALAGGATPTAEESHQNAADMEGIESKLAQRLMQDDQAGVAAMMEAAGEAVGASNIRLFTQTNLFARRMLDRMGLPELEREITNLRELGREEIAARLEAARKALGDQARSFMERQLTLFAAGATKELRENVLRNVKLSQLDRRDYQRMRGLVRDMALRIASRYSRPKKVDIRGHLDIRRTLRRNMAHEAIPFRTVWKRKKLEKPKILAICDVSGSVAQVARFLLMFLYALTDTLAGIKSYAFSSKLIEVSHILEGEDIDEAITKILNDVGFGSTNYGRALEIFSDTALRHVDRHTTVIILGDGRGNRNPPRTDLMKNLFDRAARVIWLNPEPNPLWGTGDSDIYKYMPYCHLVTSCNTVASLERVVDDILRSAQ
ncbi:MAG: VWA domain-containing protein [Acetobacteraceae bacterium]|nr:VWA domain-containing protein [Acetobacteraceae bacterium]